MSEVLELVEDLKGKLLEDMAGGKFDPVLAFLPAARTWIEFFTQTGGRMGFLLTSDASVLSAKADVIVFAPLHGKLTNAPTAPLLLHSDKPIIKDQAMNNITFGLYAMLAIINSPHFLERRAHEPHKGFQREVDRHFGRGMFPLNAWTEIRLSISPKVQAAYGEEVISNKKALHFCRSHLRIKRGKLEHVRSHWRGDPARGTKLSRYTVTN